MPTASKRQQILEEVQTRLAAIQRGDTFETDAGLTLFIGERPVVLGDDDPEAAIAILPGATEPLQQVGRKLFMAMPLEVQALAKVAVDELLAAWLMVERVLADIKRALAGPDDLFFGGLLSSELKQGPEITAERERGSNVIDISITYLLRYHETLGTP